MDADEFRAWRRRVGMTQAVAAAELNVTTRMIKHYEARTSPITARVMVQCAEVERRSRRRRTPHPDPHRDPRDIRSTPQWVFDRLHQEFAFELDAAALPSNAKCSAYFTPDDNALVQDWGGKRVWLNPPFTHGKIEVWLAKVWAEVEMKPQGRAAIVVCLLPVWTDRKWWHTYVIRAAEIRFFVGRPLRFSDGSGLTKRTDMVSCAIVVFKHGDHRCRVSSYPT
jgi:phage N-6-adenine-methyltransferase